MPQVLTDSAGAAWSISMAVGSDNSVHLCYLMGGMAPSNLIYMTNQHQDPGEWTAHTLYLAGYNATALALDSANYAHVIFYSLQVISGVGYTTNAPSGTWQAIEEVDTEWAACQSEGMALDIAIDSADEPHIVFTGDAGGEISDDVRHASRAGGVWILGEVESGDCGSAGQSISVDQDGVAHVSYHHMPTGDFRVGNNRSGSWDITTVSSDGWFNAIAADRLGQAHVGYTDGGILKYAIVQSLPDSDGDGVSDAEEDTAPNSGDGNSDGTQDSIQSHVASLETFDNAQVVTLVAPDTTVLTQVRSLSSPNPEGMPDNATFPFGYLEFTLLGADIGTRVSVDLMLPDDSANSYFNFGPTPLDSAEHWYLFDWDGETGAQVTGSTITLNLEDGQRGDQDLVANGIIQDPGGPAVGPAGSQHVRLSPPILEFGNVMVGENADLDLAVMNVGLSNLSIDSITTPDVPFSIVTENCSGEVLVPDGSCLVTVRFTPSRLGEDRKVMLVLSDDPSFPSLGVTLLGTGTPAPQAEIQVTPASLEFGNVDIGSYLELSINVTNTGMETLHVGSVGGLSMPYSIIADTVSGAVIHTGGNAQLIVRFEPQSSGVTNGSLGIPSDDPDNSPLTIPISGTGVGDSIPDIAVSRASMDFGEAMTEDLFTISNTGTGTLSWTISPALPDWLTVAPMSGDVTSTPVEVIVTVDRDLAQGSGSHNTEILISSNGGNENVFVEMTKPNTAPMAVAAFDPDNAPAGNPIQLDGSGSDDPDGDIITYQWAWENYQTYPPAAGAYISDYQSASPILTAAYAGEYSVSLTVSDGTLTSQKVFVVITLVENPEANSLPIANAGEDRMVVVDNPLVLDGTISSDPDDDPIVVFKWQFVWDEENGTYPGALGASLVDFNTANPTFSSTRPGQFTLSLKVTDGRLGESEPDLIDITVQDVSHNHSDTDGIPDSDELGPDGTAPDYDGNDDQIPDRTQNNVASMPTASGNDYITIASESGTFLSDVQVNDGTSAGALPDGFRFPQQFIAFTVNNVGVGGTTVVTIFLPDGMSAETYYKYGPTPGNPDPHWYEFMWDGTTGAQINGSVITLTFVDAQRGDDVLVPDGMIVDLGGPGVAVSGNPSGGGGSGGGCFVGSAAF